MPELMITPTPTQLPANTGNANALSQSDAAGRSGDSPKADTDANAATPFASVLKSQMDRKTTTEQAADSVAETTPTAQAETPAITIAVDLSGLLPLLGINPVTQAAATAEPADSAAEAGAAPGLTLLPGLTAVPASPATPPGLAVAQPETTALAAPAQIVAAAAGASKPQAASEHETHASVAAPKIETAAQFSGKTEPEAAINADGGRKGGEIAQPEAAVGDFRALMERAATITPGTANSASHAASGPGLRIDTPLGQNGWHEEVGQKLTWMVGNNRQQADLVLTPPQLGRVEVSLTMNGDQATAVFTSPNPAVREALEGALQRLRDVLADAGVSLGQTQVGSESPKQSSRQEERGFGAEQGVRYASTVALPGASTVTRSGSGRGMVDVFA